MKESNVYRKHGELKELLERHNDMRSSLLAVTRAICFEYHPESRIIEAMKIISGSTQGIVGKIIRFGSKRDDLEKDLTDCDLLWVGKLDLMTSSIEHIQGTGRYTAREDILISRSGTERSAGVNTDLTILSGQIEDIGDSLHIYQSFGGESKILGIIDSIPISKILQDLRDLHKLLSHFLLLLHTEYHSGYPIIRPQQEDEKDTEDHHHDDKLQ